jgi:hypothetical protein
MRAFEKLQRAVKARVAAMETPDQVPATPWRSLTPGRRPIGQAGTSDRADSYIETVSPRNLAFLTPIYERAAAEISSRHQHRHKTTGGDSKERRS